MKLFHTIEGEDMDTQIAFPAMIKEYRLANNLTMDQLAKKIGKTKSTISKWESGTRSPKIQEIEELAKFFNIEPTVMMFGKAPASSTSQNATAQAINDTVIQLYPERQEIVLEVATEQLDEQENRRLEERKTLEISEPLFEYYVYEKLSAGTGATYWEERNYDTVYFDKEITHDLASWIYGDSMEPKYLDGSVALIKDTGFDYDGAIYAVDWDGQSYIKKVYKEKDGLRLVSLNNKYADKFAPYSEDPRIIGKVIGNFMPMER